MKVWCDRYPNSEVLCPDESWIVFRGGKATISPRQRDYLISSNQDGRYSFHKWELAERVTIVRLCGIGDLLMLSPCFKRIKEIVPNCYVTFFTAAQYMALFDNNPYINKVLPATQGATFGDYWKEDLFYDVTSYVEHCQGLWEKNRIDLFAEGLKLGELNYRIPMYFITSEEKSKARAILAEMGITDKNKILGIEVRSTRIERDYLYNKELAQLYAKNNWKVLLFDVNPQMGWEDENVFNTCGKFNDLRILGAMIERCDLFCAPDSGLYHWRAAFQKPLIGFFNQINPDLRSRYYVNKYDFYMKGTCSSLGCQYRACNRRVCMEAIKPEMVVEKAKELWNY